MKLTQTAVKAFGLDDKSWKRHANAWSVWTRMLGLGPILTPIYYRETLGWWAMIPIALGAGWMWVNPHVFPAVEEPRSWAEKGIYGEKMYAANQSLATDAHRPAMRWLIALAAVGAVLLAWGLILIEAWPSIFGITLIVLSQLWQIDRFVAIYAEGQRRSVTTPR